MGYDFTGGRIFHFPIDFCMGLTTVQLKGAACDNYNPADFQCYSIFKRWHILNTVATDPIGSASEMRRRRHLCCGLVNTAPLLSESKVSKSIYNVHDKTKSHNAPKCRSVVVDFVTFRKFRHSWPTGNLQ